jgi:excisionase family DNA binding protein
MTKAQRLLTIEQAADLLNLPRSFLVSLLEKDEIKHTMDSRHRRIRTDDLLAYKQSRDAKRSKALSDLAELDGEHL